MQYNLGVLRQQQGRFADALKAYDEVVRIDGGKRADAHYAAALIYEARGEAAAAVQALRLALAARPEWTAAATELAWLLAVAADSLVRNPEEAVRLATEAVGVGRVRFDRRMLVCRRRFIGRRFLQFLQFLRFVNSPNRIVLDHRQ